MHNVAELPGFSGISLRSFIGRANESSALPQPQWCVDGAGTAVCRERQVLLVVYQQVVETGRSQALGSHTNLAYHWIPRPGFFRIATPSSLSPLCKSR